MALGAGVILLLLFWWRYGSPLQNKVEYQQAYNSIPTTTIEGLITKDTDGDGVPDWEERLYGLDPTKKETTPGTPDSVAIQKLVASDNQPGAGAPTSGATPSDQKLTQTDQFSRELFSTVATLSQNGTLDQDTVNQIAKSLANSLQNQVSAKVYLYSDLQVSDDNSPASRQKYIYELKKVPVNLQNKTSVPEIFHQFAPDDNTVNPTALVQLSPITNQIDTIIKALVKIPVPNTLAQAHLNFINAYEGMSENLKNIQLYDSDPILAVGAITQYQQKSADLDRAILALKKSLNM